MTTIGVLGAGAFGTALAVALAGPGRQVQLWARADADAIRTDRENKRRLPGVRLPDAVIVQSDLAAAALPEILLLAVPMQELDRFAADNVSILADRTLLACCKGLHVGSGLGPSGIMSKHCPHAHVGLLSGPSFAVDIAAGLPTALTLACAEDTHAARVQEALANRVIRFYRTTDLIGVEIGGALKNVVAIAAGIVAGAGLGHSATAALITRGFAEMERFAAARGADPRTLTGLSGLGDLILTCSSPKSRNFSHGLAIGRGGIPDAGQTVEGVATTQAIRHIATAQGIDMPIAETLGQILDGGLTVRAAIDDLLSRPLRRE